jgi:DNA repair exonuclease SbcCD nuclease subunit
MIYPEFPNVVFLGDVHLGKRFIEGVPLERRGEREVMVWDQFHRDLRAHNGDFHIQVGDLFDTFDVPNDVVLRAASMYISAAEHLAGCQFYVLRGNHDASRSDFKASSFEVFKRLVSHQINIMVVDEPYVSLENEFGFLPWDPYQSAVEQVKALGACLPLTCAGLLMAPLKFVVCHCDVESYGGDLFNVLPIRQLSNLTYTVVTGHDHTPRSFKSDGIQVHVTGSMQPYSHGEDPEHTLYKTVTPAELTALGDVSKFYIRVLLQPGETPPEVPDCLGYKTKLTTEKDEAPDLEVADIASFDTTDVFKSILNELKVVGEVQAKVLEKFTEALNA